MDHYYVEECGCGITHEYRYDYLANGTIILTGYQGDDDYPCILYIPASINGRPVKAIAAEAFAGNDGIEYAILPDGIVEIGNSAFFECAALEWARLPESLTCIGKSAFDCCHNLRTLSIPPQIKSIEAGTFYGCLALTRVTLPKGLQSIGRLAFGDCTSLKTLELPEGLVEIGEKAFIIPGHCCSTVNLYDNLYLYSGEIITERLPVTARGKSQ